MVEKDPGSYEQDNSNAVKKHSYRPHKYKEKNPMTRIQLRYFQINKKASREVSQPHVQKEPMAEKKEMPKKLLKERLTLAASSIKPAKGNLNDHISNHDDEMVLDNFGEISSDEFQITCNLFSVLLVEYDCVFEVFEVEKEVAYDEVDNQKPQCYYVMNNNVIKEQHVGFKKPYSRMIYLLKPLLTSEKVDNVAVNKMFIE